MATAQVQALSSPEREHSPLHKSISKGKLHCGTGRENVLSPPKPPGTNM